MAGGEQSVENWPLVVWLPIESNEQSIQFDRFLLDQVVAVFGINLADLGLEEQGGNKHE